MLLKDEIHNLLGFEPPISEGQGSSLVIFSFQVDSTNNYDRFIIGYCLRKHGSSEYNSMNTGYLPIYCQYVILFMPQYRFDLDPQKQIPMIVGKY